MAEEKSKASSEIKLFEDEDLKKVEVANLHSASDPGTVKITQTTTIKSSSDAASTGADPNGGKVTVTTTTTTSSASTSEAKAEGGDVAKTSIVEAIKSAVENPKIETVTTTTTNASTEGVASSEAKPGLDSSVLVLTTTVAEPKTETVTTTTINTSSEAGSTGNKENSGINLIAETLTTAVVQPKTQETVTVTTYASSETAKPTEANALAEVITKAVEEPKKQETVTVTKIETSTAEKPTALVTSAATESQQLSEEKPTEVKTTTTVTKVDAEPKLSTEPADNKQENTTTTTTTSTVVEPKKEETVTKIAKVTSIAGNESAEPQKEEEKSAQVKTLTTTTTTSVENVTPTEAEAKTDSAASVTAKKEENTAVTTTTSLTNEPNTASNKETVTLTNLPDEDSDIEEIKKSLNTISTSIPKEEEETKIKVETAVAPPKKKTPKDNIPLKALIILKKIHLDDNLFDEKNYEENEDDEIIEPVYILPNEYLSRLQPIKNGPKIGVQQPKHQEFSYQPHYPTIANNKPQETYQTYGSYSANQPQDLYYNELYSSTRRNEPQAQYHNGFYQPSNNTQSQVQYYGNQYQYQDPYKYTYPSTENGKAIEEIKTSQISPKKYNILSPAFTYNEDPNPQRKQLFTTEAQQTSPIISTKPNVQLQIAPQIELQNNVYSYDSTPVYKSDPYNSQTSQLNNFYSGYSSNGNSMPDRTNIIDEIVAKIQKDEAKSLKIADTNPDPYQYTSSNQNAFQNLTSLPDEFVIYKTKASSELSYALVEENLIKEATPNKIEEIFQDIDADGTGKITPQSLWTILQTVNAKFNKSYTFADAQSFFYALDSNSDGQLDLEEFTRAFKYAAESINN
jgi:hypothetical protein